MLPLPFSDSHFQALAVSDAPRDAGLPRCALRGSLDPITGIFYRAPEHHTRMRTLQACEKCRVRKAKCSGDHPVCERCRIRGLTCHYAPERRARRWIKPAPPSGELDSRDSRSSVVASSRHPTTDTDRHNGHAGEVVQLGHMAVPPSAEATTTSASSEDIIVPLEQPIRPHHAVDTQPVPTKTSTSAASDNTPRVEEYALKLAFDPYVNYPRAAFFQPIFSSMTDGDTDHKVLTNHDPVYIDRGLTIPGCPERRVQPYPVLFHPPLRPHQSGPGPGPPFPVDDHLALPCPSSIDSPDRSDSTCTSLTASPVLTRPSSRGLPTPISSYPSLPFSFASLSPTLGPHGFDPQGYPHFSTEVMDQGQPGQCGGTWSEINDGAGAWEGSTFFDMDSVF